MGRSLNAQQSAASAASRRPPTSTPSLIATARHRPVSFATPHLVSHKQSTPALTRPTDSSEGRSRAISDPSVPLGCPEKVAPVPAQLIRLPAKSASSAPHATVRFMIVLESDFALLRAPSAHSVSHSRQSQNASKRWCAGGMAPRSHAAKQPRADRELGFSPETEVRRGGDGRRTSSRVRTVPNRAKRPTCCPAEQDDRPMCPTCSPRAESSEFWGMLRVFQSNAGMAADGPRMSPSGGGRPGWRSGRARTPGVGAV